MDTTAAAATAGVTVPTIRTWCRIGVIAATKRAGKWIIAAASLHRRITIGAMRARKAKPMTTGTIVQTSDGSYGICGNAAALAAVYEAGTPVTPTNEPYSQDRLYLGHTRETRGDYGRTLETRGLAYTKDNGEAVYYVDMERLADAPAFSAALQELEDEMDAAEAAMARADDDYLNPRYT